MLDQQIDIFIEKWLLEGFGDFFKDLMISCGHQPDAGNIPLVVSHWKFKVYSTAVSYFCYISLNSCISNV